LQISHYWIRKKVLALKLNNKEESIDAQHLKGDIPQIVVNVVEKENITMNL